MAVQASQQGPYVWAVNQGRAQMKPISVARVEGEESVIDHGVAPGDVVVTDGQLRLTPNSRIAERTEGGRGGRGAAEAQ